MPANAAGYTAQAGTGELERAVIYVKEQQTITALKSSVPPNGFQMLKSYLKEPKELAGGKVICGLYGNSLAQCYIDSPKGYLIGLGSAATVPRADIEAVAQAIAKHHGAS